MPWIAMAPEEADARRSRLAYEVFDPHSLCQDRGGQGEVPERDQRVGLQGCLSLLRLKPHSPFRLVDLDALATAAVPIACTSRKSHHWFCTGVLSKLGNEAVSRKVVLK